MKRLTLFSLTLVPLLWLTAVAYGRDVTQQADILQQAKILQQANDQEANVMVATGSFEVTLDPQTEDAVSAGRMVINKAYVGDLEASGSGQMLSKRVDGGAAVYSAIEEVSGTLAGKEGAFTLFHVGTISAEGAANLSISIVEGSGTGQLKGIRGELAIRQEGAAHFYELQYSF